MRKKRFLAIVTAIIFSISLAAPVTVSATEAEEAADLTDEEQEEGEQTTIVAPGAEDEDASGNGGSSTGSSSGNTGTGSSAATTTAKSSDSSLSHLGISPGSLSPAFSAGTHEYTATVDAGVTAISVAAKPNSSKAVIASVSGAKSLTPGANTVKVIVEAENGATTTYTITVNCGSSAGAAQAVSQEDTMGDDAASDDGMLEGEISAIDDAGEEEKEQSEVTFDDNGYLIYEGNAYLPSSMMPEGEYVSLEKYNKLYEQAQAQKSKSMRLLIIFVVIAALLLIVILNLALKLRDIRQDVKLGLDDIEDEEPEKKHKIKSSKARKETKEQEGLAMQTDTSMIPDVKLPDEMKPVKQNKVPKPAQPPKPEKPAKPVKPPKPAQTAKKAEDLEILDLNDL